MHTIPFFVTGLPNFFDEGTLNLCRWFDVLALSIVLADDRCRSAWTGSRSNACEKVSHQSCLNLQRLAAEKEFSLVDSLGGC